jgi:type IV pilus assembly protein PilV
MRGIICVMRKNLSKKRVGHLLQYVRKSKDLMSCNNGFSLMEVMISLVILAIGVLALTQLQLTVTQGNGSANTMTTAVSLAEQKIESLKTASYTTIQSESPTAVTASDGRTYTRQVIVTNNQPMVNVKTVQVLVSGADGQRTFTVPLSTVIAQ